MSISKYVVIVSPKCKTRAAIEQGSIWHLKLIGK
jgi:hypothetical protein